MSNLKGLHAEIANHAGDIADLFKSGAHVTILVRNPVVNDGDVLVTDDQIDLAIAALQNLKAKEELKLTSKDVISNSLGLEGD